MRQPADKAVVDGNTHIRAGAGGESNRDTKWFFHSALRPDHQQWKFVVRDDADEAGLRMFLDRYPAFVERQLPIVLQPEGDVATVDYPTALERLAERVRDPFWDRYYVRTLPQMHVIVWGRRRWV